MAGPFCAALADRALLAVSGPDAHTFLQGLISNDVGKIRDGGAIYAALLTPQGKFLHDFFVFELDRTLHLDCEAERLDDLARRLAMYRLRARVGLDRVGTLRVCALFGAPIADIARGIEGGAVYPDPRMAALGARAALHGGAEALRAAGCRLAPREAYDSLRLGLGVPDGSRDLAVGKSFPLEYGFEELNGVDFEKGCYVGQEVTVRMKHRGRLRKRLVAVEVAGPVPAPGTPILDRGAEVGELRSAANGRGLALLRSDRLGSAAQEGVELRAGEARIALARARRG